MYVHTVFGGLFTVKRKNSETSAGHRGWEPRESELRTLSMLLIASSASLVVPAEQASFSASNASLSPGMRSDETLEVRSTLSSALCLRFRSFSCIPALAMQDMNSVKLGSSFFALEKRSGTIVS